jgi:hypothetical protein
MWQRERTEAGQAVKELKLKACEAPERDILSATLDYLDVSPAVVWAARMNVATGYLVPYRIGQRLMQAGALKASEVRYMQFGFPGLSDIVGQLVTGQFLAVETKRRSGRIRDEQAGFIARVNAGEGVGLIIKDPDEVHKAIQGFKSLARP